MCSELCAPWPPSSADLQPPEQLQQTKALMSVPPGELLYNLSWKLLVVNTLLRHNVAVFVLNRSPACVRVNEFKESKNTPGSFNGESVTTAGWKTQVLISEKHTYIYLSHKNRK